MFETSDLNKFNLKNIETLYGKVFCQTLHMHVKESFPSIGNKLIGRGVRHVGGVVGKAESNHNLQDTESLIGYEAWLTVAFS